MRTICYLDMDEVLADFRAQGIRFTNCDCAPIKNKTPVEMTPAERDGMSEIFRQCDYSNEFWNQMPLKEGAKELYAYCREHFDEVILLSRYIAPEVAPERFKAIQFMKLKWAHQYFSDGDELPKVVVTDKPKSVFLQNRPDLRQILIDDLVVNVQGWQNAGGIAILHETASDTISKLAELTDTCRVNTGQKNIPATLNVREHEPYA